MESFMALSRFRTARARQVTTNGELREQIIATFKEKQYSPIKEMIEIAMDANHPVEVRAALHRELAQYVYPKVRAVQETDPDGGGGGNQPREIQIVRFGEDAVSKAMDLDPTTSVDDLVRSNLPAVRMEAQEAVLLYGVDPDDSVTVDVTATLVEE